MKRVGMVGWRGMVGSVLMQRMQQEGDFDHVEPIFFTTSQVGGEGPGFGKGATKLCDARDVKQLKAMQIIISCQGGDYTNEIFPRLRGEGWNGLLDRRGVGAAHARRRRHHPRSGQPQRDRCSAQSRDQELHRRQLHREPHAHGHARLVQGGPGGMDHGDDLSGGVRRGRAEHARTAIADGPVARRASSLGSTIRCLAFSRSIAR